LKGNQDERKALRQALESNDLPAVQAALDRGLDCNEPLDPGDPNSLTPLCIAAAHGSMEAADLLLKKGARIDVPSLGGYYLPLHFALQSPRLEIIRLLLQHGAGIESHTQKHQLTPLMSAANDHKPRAAEVLIELGADVNARTADAGETPLMYAAHSGNMEIIRLLLDKGADVNARRCDRRTAADIAYMSMQVAAYNLLKELPIKA